MNLQYLPHLARIWVPYQERALRDKLEADLAKAAGGWTSYQATGGWRSDLTGATLKEIVVVYEVTFNDRQHADVNQALGDMAQLLLESEQEAVLIEWDGKRNLYRK
jgi:hypothetical protein